MKTNIHYGRSSSFTLPVGGSPRAPATPPHQLETRRDALQNVSSMDFELLFGHGLGDDDHESDDVEPMMETVAETAIEEEKMVEDETHHALDPVSVYVRIVGNLSRPRDALEHNIAKRFAAACTHVGVGELGDAAHIEALQRAFNGLKMDPVLGYEPVAKTAADHVANAGCAAPSDSPAFVATTPGAAGHAALLNLRHSFLWLKPSDAAADAAHCPLTKRGGCVGGGGDARHHGSQRQGDAEILVLEPDIKAHFVIAKPTHGYRRLVDALPDHFVGTHKRLVELVDFVCEQMLVSFRETGMSVPPWRKNKSILSKWFLPTAKSGSQPTTPTGSPASAAQAVLQRQSFGFGARVGEQPRQLSFVRMNLGESGSPPMEYAAPVVGENASPNKVAFGFSAGTVRSIAVPA